MERAKKFWTGPTFFEHWLKNDKKYYCHVQPDNIPLVMMLQEFYRKFDLGMYELDFVVKGSDVVVDLTKTSLEICRGSMRNGCQMVKST